MRFCSFRSPSLSRSDDSSQFIPFLIKLYEEGKFPVDNISKTFPAENFEDAVHAMYVTYPSLGTPSLGLMSYRRHSGEVIKPIILF